MNIDEYLSQFNVLGKDEYLNTEHISFILYKTILSKFRTFFTSQEHELLMCYQIRTLSLIENLRKLDTVFIDSVMKYIQSQNIYLVDIIIMMWCFPTDIGINKNTYDMKYEKNTKKYNHKMIKLVNEDYLENFCIESISRNGHIPIHCFDYIWNYIDSVDFTLEFINYNCGDYIKISIYQEKIVDSDIELQILLGINMVYLMKNGLGNCKYKHQIDNVSFNEIIYKMLYTKNISDELLKSKTGENFKIQMNQIKKNPELFFESSILEMIQEK